MVNLVWHLPGEGRRRDYTGRARQKKCNANEEALALDKEPLKWPPASPPLMNHSSNRRDFFGQDKEIKSKRANPKKTEQNNAMRLLKTNDKISYKSYHIP